MESWQESDALIGYLGDVLDIIWTRYVCVIPILIRKGLAFRSTSHLPLPKPATTTASGAISSRVYRWDMIIWQSRGACGPTAASAGNNPIILPNNEPGLLVVVVSHSFLKRPLGGALQAYGSLSGNPSDDRKPNKKLGCGGSLKGIITSHCFDLFEKLYIVRIRTRLYMSSHSFLEFLIKRARHLLG